ncbi:HAD family phosphatase [Telluribacter sp. SYSU D00476]|uniref:HAD family hydrolase n=1 Tax=Telluribacter sp. SYSU D00476 TaxID=2811430 RepID=UPI001FF13D1C|nr:HAD family phosphatase [Telluribacter sp. SYSU D00476]
MENTIAVIFDMDGVICHTNPYHSKAFREFFAKRDLSPTDEEFAQHMFGKSNSYILSHFLQREVVGEEFKQLEDEKESLFRTIYEPYIEPIGGLLEFIASLKQNGVKTGVATSAPCANLDLIIDKLDLRKQMESILASEDVTKHKPDPEVYLTSAQNLGVDPKQCVVFEDSYSGVSAALNAGMKVVGVLTSHTREELPPCDLYIENYHEMSFAKVKELF